MPRRAASRTRAIVVGEEAEVARVCERQRRYVVVHDLQQRGAKERSEKMGGECAAAP